MPVAEYKIISELIVDFSSAELQSRIEVWRGEVLLYSARANRGIAAFVAKILASQCLKVLDPLLSDAQKAECQGSFALSDSEDDDVEERNGAQEPPHKSQLKIQQQKQQLKQHQHQQQMMTKMKKLRMQQQQLQLRGMQQTKMKQ